MNGTVREEARTALQALLSASKAPPPVHQNGNHQDEEGMLRRRFRADIQQALRRPPSAAKAAEQDAVERQVSKLLEVIQTSAGSAPAPAAVVEEEGDEDAAEESAELTPPASPQPIPQRILTRTEEGGIAASLRTQVADARKRLAAMDRKVTELTRDLKLGRSEIWTHQQSLSLADTKVAKTLQERAADLDPSTREEEVRLEKEERELAQALGEARANAARWSSVAKRQDTMLQQERESQRGGDAHGILAKHPAGEVFLPRFARDDDDDSDDDRYRRRHWPRQQSDDNSPYGGEDLHSDDSDDDIPVPRAPGSNNDMRGVSKDPPPPPAPQHRGTAPPALRMDDGDSSDGGSNLPTPSSDAYSQSGSPAGVSPKRGGLNGGGTGTAVQRISLGSDSRSESDEEAGAPVKAKGEAPPLPELKGINNTRPPIQEDEAEEVSSEDGLSTSRSV